jgi:hypothetical protein
MEIGRSDYEERREHRIPEDVLPKLTPLWIENGVRYFGNL